MLGASEILPAGMSPSWIIGLIAGGGGYSPTQSIEGARGAIYEPDGKNLQISYPIKRYSDWHCHFELSYVIGALQSPQAWHPDRLHPTINSPMAAQGSRCRHRNDVRSEYVWGSSRGNPGTGQKMIPT